MWGVIWTAFPVKFKKEKLKYGLFQNFLVYLEKNISKYLYILKVLVEKFWKIEKLGGWKG